MMELNKIYNESCLETMSRMPDGFIDMVLTSPPYDNLRTYDNDIDKTWGAHIWQPIIKELYRVVKDGGVVVWIVGDATINGSETGTSFRQALYAMECGFNLLDTMIYYQNGTGAKGSNYAYWQSFEYMFVFTKGFPFASNRIADVKNSVGGKRRKLSKKSIMVNTRIHRSYVINPFYSVRPNVWIFNCGFSDSSDKTEHPAPFPEKLAADHIYSWSNEGDIVYDPFMGSGTTAKMAHIYKRKWIGSEISSKYVELAYKRIDPYLRQTSLF